MRVEEVGWIIWISRQRGPAKGVRFEGSRRNKLHSQLRGQFSTEYGYE